MSATNHFGSWVVDPAHSEVHFKIRHLVISTVTGSFNQFEGSVHPTQDAGFENAKIRFSIDAASVDTNQQMRDDHLRGADFFDVANFPKIEFEATSFRKKSGQDYELSGELSLHGQTRPVTLDAEFGGMEKDAYGNLKAGFEVSGRINRKDFGLSYNAVTEAGGLALGEDVRLVANIQIAKQPA